MRRTPWFRSLALTFALWLPLVTGEPGLIDPCPMHGSAAFSEVIGTGAAASMQASHMAHMHGMVSAQDQHGENPVRGHGHNCCTCIGCCAMSTAALRAPEPALTVSTVVVDGSREWSRASSRSRGRRRNTLGHRPQARRAHSAARRSSPPLVQVPREGRACAGCA